MTATTPAAATAEAPAAKERKERKARTNFSTALRGPEGETFRVYLKQRKNGTVLTYTVHTVRVGKKKKSEKGATKEHPGLEPAKARVEALVASAVKLGWKIPERKSGFKSKPDIYTEDNLPAPGVAPKPAAKGKSKK